MTIVSDPILTSLRHREDLELLTTIVFILILSNLIVVFIQRLSHSVKHTITDTLI